MSAPVRICVCEHPEPSGTLNGGVEVCMKCGDFISEGTEKEHVSSKVTINPFEHPREPQMINVTIVALDSEGNEISDRTDAVMVVDYGPGEIKWGLLNAISIRLHDDRTAYSGFRVRDAETGEVLVDPNQPGY